MTNLIVTTAIQIFLGSSIVFLLVNQYYKSVYNARKKKQ